MTQRLKGCPLPESITLQQRLTALLGANVLVESPAGSFEAAPILEVRDRFFRVMDVTVRYDQAFFATVLVPPEPALLTSVIVREEGLSPGLGVKSGRLVRIGQDFVEFVQSIPGGRAVVIAPLNRFVTVTCEEQPEE